MMISPPTESPSTRDMPLATRRMMTRGLIKKRRRLTRAAKRDSLTMLFEPWRPNRRCASSEVSPAGVAWSSSSNSGRGLSQKPLRGVLFVRAHCSGFDNGHLSPWMASQPAIRFSCVHHIHIAYA